jgi:4-nitrophenyl phosphatase
MTPEIHPESRIEDVPGTVIFDLDGVIYLGPSTITGAPQALATLFGTGWQILFATNNSAATPISVARHLSERVSLTIDPTTIMTSATATATYLIGQRLTSALVVGSQQLEDTIRASGVSIVGPEEAAAVVVGRDTSLNQATIDTACLAISEGARFVATNTDATFPTPDGPVAGAGETVDTIAAASGEPFVVCGKPHQPMVELVAAQVSSDNVWMIGDRLETDVAFAKQANWISVLTLSGVTQSGTEFPEGLVPDFVIDSIADLPTLLDKATRSRLDEG